MADDSTDQTPSTTGDTGEVGSTGPTGRAGTPDKPVVRKKIASKRVTPKGGPTQSPAKGATRGSTSAHAHAPDGNDAGYSSRYTPPSAKYADAPSPTWVPVLMFALLILGGLLIVANYARLFGDPSNTYLIIGLAFILGGIITATNYR